MEDLEGEVNGGTVLLFHCLLSHCLIVPLIYNLPFHHRNVDHNLLDLNRIDPEDVGREHNEICVFPRLKRA